MALGFNIKEYIMTPIGPFIAICIMALNFMCGLFLLIKLYSDRKFNKKWKRMQKYEERK